MAANARHAAWDLDCRQACAAIECLVANAVHAAWDLDCRQVLAAMHQRRAKTCHTQANLHVSCISSVWDVSSIESPILVDFCPLITVFIPD